MRLVVLTPSGGLSQATAADSGPVDVGAADPPWWRVTGDDVPLYVADPDPLCGAGDSVPVDVACY
jgi:hypothetical protein